MFFYHQRHKRISSKNFFRRQMQIAAHCLLFRFIRQPLSMHFFTISINTKICAFCIKRNICAWLVWMEFKKDLRLSTEGRVKYRSELINSDFSFCAFTTASGDNFLLSPVHPDVPALLVINDDKEVSPKRPKFLSESS